eukprot:TRINITY_DN1466_c0_g1_i1.p1 TRINITY_DN1466_c0_g1~~TRINITY_DN1466_c0_g1_i1.p1  ORF type:complete len:587 (-),score=166.11 TRINITY_DN1466_c0_g1_i1:832-2592(-)
MEKKEKKGTKRKSLSRKKSSTVPIVERSPSKEQEPEESDDKKSSTSKKEKEGTSITKSMLSIFSSKKKKQQLAQSLADSEEDQPQLSISAPSNFNHKLHVDKTLNWIGKDVDKEFEMMDLLGEGTFGRVFKARHKQADAVVAIKIVKADDSDLASIQKEMKILQTCRHDAVVSYYGCIRCGPEIWMIMDYCGVGAIDDLMDRAETTLNEDQIAYVVFNSLKGLQFLHSRKILHRDIKSANILLTEIGEVKLADFGVSAEISNAAKRRTVVGSPYWMAPEVVKESPYDYRCDIWSLGITCIEMAERRPPHYEKNPLHAMMQIPLVPSPTLKNPERFSDDFNNFLSICLKKNPDERATIPDLLLHPFLRNAHTKKDSLMILVTECERRKEEQKDNSWNATATMNGNTGFTSTAATAIKRRPVAENTGTQTSFFEGAGGTFFVHDSVDQPPPGKKTPHAGISKDEGDEEAEGTTVIHGGTKGDSEGDGTTVIHGGTKGGADGTTVIHGGTVGEGTTIVHDDNQHHKKTKGGNTQAEYDKIIKNIAAQQKDEPEETSPQKIRNQPTAAKSAQFCRCCRRKCKTWWLIFSR